MSNAASTPEFKRILTDLYDSDRYKTSGEVLSAAWEEYRKRYGDTRTTQEKRYAYRQTFENPGAQYHLTKATKAHLKAKRAPNKEERDHQIGAFEAHLESATDARAMGMNPKLTWHTSAPGTGAYNQRHHSYSTPQMEIGEYHISPPSKRGGGYVVQFFSRVTPTGWHTVGYYASPARAKAAAQKHYESLAMKKNPNFSNGQIVKVDRWGLGKVVDYNKFTDEYEIELAIGGKHWFKSARIKADMRRNPIAVYNPRRSLGACQCSDPGCPVHPKQSACKHKATKILYRSDMDDRTGTPVCAGCADDMLESGVFYSKNPVEMRPRIQVSKRRKRGKIGSRSPLKGFKINPRTSRGTLDQLVSYINKTLGTDFTIGRAYGGLRIEAKGGSQDVSPRLTPKEMELWIRAFITCMDYYCDKTRKNPPSKLLPMALLEMRYQRTGGEYRKELFKHEFKSPRPKVYGLADGSLWIVGHNRLWGTTE